MSTIELPPAEEVPNLALQTVITVLESTFFVFVLGFIIVNILVAFTSTLTWAYLRYKRRRTLREQAIAAAHHRHNEPRKGRKDAEDEAERGMANGSFTIEGDDDEDLDLEMENSDAVPLMEVEVRPGHTR